VGKPVVGDIVVLPFPQTNLQQGKRRPALVVVDLPGDDLILCQITSQAHRDSYSLALDNKISKVASSTCEAISGQIDSSRSNSRSFFIRPLTWRAASLTKRCRNFAFYSREQSGPIGIAPAQGRTPTLSELAQELVLATN
jgi:hypothetical protein